MNKSDLQNLFSSVKDLPGISDKTFEKLAKLGCYRIIDFIWHFPVNIIIRMINPDLKQVETGHYVIIDLTIAHINHVTYSYKKKPFKIRAYDQNSNHISLVFFNYYPSFIIKDFRIGTKIKVTGKIDKFGDDLQLAHPEFIQNNNHFDKVELIYNLTYGITSKQLHKYVRASLEYLPKFPEWLDQDLIKQKDWSSFSDSILKLHNPLNCNDLLPISKYKERLAYDELFAHQLSLELMRIHLSRVKVSHINSKGILIEQLLASLGFSLTDGQISIIKQITEDQLSDHRMMRLVQGDVGSGKTVIALAAALNAVESKKQASIMVPTDILANQHYNWMLKVTENLPVNIALLTGKIKGKARKVILEDLEIGKIDILIGTHALFQDKVIFHDLALTVIDEQHRFGVSQRIALSQKGNNPDLLIMSATPIPRTLTLITSGDMDISKLTDKPKGRIPIKTSLVSNKKMQELLYSIANLINENGKAYWICPLVEEQEKESDNFSRDLVAAIARYNEFNILFPGKVGLIHGKMKFDEKEQAMLDFVSGKTNLLVATTVIEVGIDVKDATVIVIEQAERFGLSQLHQLRGRVGRGDKESYCILLYHSPISLNAKAKLNIMKETNDGFLIAEEDLRIRGAGEMLGTRQSGLANFKIADLNIHEYLIEQATINAKKIIANDPMLISDQGRLIRNLLYLFEYEKQVEYLNG